MRKTLTAEFSGLSVAAIGFLACSSFTAHPLAYSVTAMIVLSIDLDVSFKSEES